MVAPAAAPIIGEPIFFTDYPGEDHPFHHGRGRALKVTLRGFNVLRCQEEQEQECQVGSGVTDKLDEGLADE